MLKTAFGQGFQAAFGRYKLSGANQAVQPMGAPSPWSPMVDAHLAALGRFGVPPDRSVARHNAYVSHMMGLGENLPDDYRQIVLPPEWQSA